MARRTAGVVNRGFDAGVEFFDENGGGPVSAFGSG
jgi:hypothetical protein